MPLGRSMRNRTSGLLNWDRIEGRPPLPRVGSICTVAWLQALAMIAIGAKATGPRFKRDVGWLRQTARAHGFLGDKRGV
jgi:hypothetical protein